MARQSGKKQPRKMKAEPNKGKKKEEVAKAVAEPFDDDSTFNFRGLPPRDLKKNLGCG